MEASLKGRPLSSLTELTQRSEQMAIVTLECARLHDLTFLAWLSSRGVSYEFSLNPRDLVGAFPTVTFHGGADDLRDMIGEFWLDSELKKSIEY